LGQTELVGLVSKPLGDAEVGWVMLRSIVMPRNLSAGLRTCAMIWFSLAMASGPYTRAAFAQPPTPSELVTWLDNPETEWVATARLQAIPDAALPLLLQPGRIASGPHDRWTAHMLALAKLGEPAIPSITDRVIAILRESDSNAFAAAHPFIKILGSLGTAAVPKLLQIAESSTIPYVTFDALDEIVRLEPRTTFFGQSLSPWLFWRPADARLDELRRELVPQLPRLRKLMERALTEWKPQAPAPHRAAAYLLARWGEGETRARGLQVLEELARANEPLYYNLDSIRLLHALGVPETTSLIRQTASRVPDTNDLKGQYLLSMAIALHQLGDRDYGPLLSEALRDSRPYVRMDAARFVASSAEISHVALLLPLLDDHAEWNGRTVEQVALESLQRLTLEQLGTDPKSWRTWFETNRDVSRDMLVARRVKAHLAVVREVPIWEANRWIDAFDGAEGAALHPLIDQYLDRRDLDASAVGPNSSRGSGGSGPIGMHGPRIVTLLLDMTIRRVPGALQRLTDCLDAADPQVRMFGALALAAFDRPRAVERLAIEAKGPEAWHRSRASEFLLQLGDKRGIPARLEVLASDQEAARMFACRDLRVYTQEALPCDARASASDRSVNLSAWQVWWERAEPTFSVKTRLAELDLQVFPLISPVSIGGRPVR
jgi:HEAT repeat protein